MSMITLKDLYSVLSAVVPLYVTMFLAYFSVKWWKIFTPDQCAGINKFVAIFAVPLLSFEFISKINPYKMDLLFISADTVSKCVMLTVFFTWAKLSRIGSLDWAITLFSLSTLPNTLVMGIPLLKSMYGDDKEGLMIQAVVLQCVIWYTLLLFLFEYRAARIIIMQKLNGNSDRISTNSDTFQTKKVDQESFSGDDVVHVIVTRPSNSDSPSEPNLQVEKSLVKVSPESQRFSPVVSATTEEDGKEVHLFVWKCGCCNTGGICEQSIQVCSKERKSVMKPESLQDPDYSASMSREMLRSIIKMVAFKLLTNPNSYASILGLGWAFASCRWDIKRPQILENSVTILSNAGLGMAMFSLGLFMALQPRIIACGSRLAVYGMLVRFIAGPAVMALASVGVGLRGTVLKVSIVQAALPQGIVPFVFAREYSLHPEVLSTAVIFGMIVSLPISIVYYICLGL